LKPLTFNKEKVVKSFDSLSFIVFGLLHWKPGVWMFCSAGYTETRADLSSDKLTIGGLSRFSFSQECLKQRKASRAYLSLDVLMPFASLAKAVGASRDRIS
jgi:hypothetical protein